MGYEERETRSGISFRDVADLCRQVGKEHNGRVHLELHLPVRSGGGAVLDVRAVLKRGTGAAGAWVDCAGHSGLWPSGASATFAGLCFRLVYELSAKLDEEVRAAERAAAGQLRLL